MPGQANPADSRPVDPLLWKQSPERLRIIAEAIEFILGHLFDRRRPGQNTHIDIPGVQAWEVTQETQLGATVGGKKRRRSDANPDSMHKSDNV